MSEINEGGIPPQSEQEPAEKSIPKPDRVISDASFHNLDTQPGQTLIMSGGEGLTAGQDLDFQIGNTNSAVRLYVEAVYDDGNFKVRHKDSSRPVYMQIEDPDKNE